MGSPSSIGEAPPAAAEPAGKLSFAVRLRQLAEHFDDNPLRNSKAIALLAVLHRESFAAAGIEVLDAISPGAGHKFLLRLLLERGFLLAVLGDRSRLSRPEAVALVRRIASADPMIDVRLLHQLLRADPSGPANGAAPPAEEVLGVLDEASPARRILPTLVQLLRHRDPRVRSKVALLVGRGNGQLAWAMSDADPRVRANAVESLWGAGTELARQMLRDALLDPHNRVVGNALLGLLRLGDRDAVRPLLVMAANQSARHRATAAWVMGESQDKCFASTLRRLLEDADPDVRRNAARSLDRLGENHSA